jgi:hypothetical protein
MCEFSRYCAPARTISIVHLLLRCLKSPRQFCHKIFCRQFFARYLRFLRESLPLARLKFPQTARIMLLLMRLFVASFFGFYSVGSRVRANYLGCWRRYLGHAQTAAWNAASTPTCPDLLILDDFGLKPIQPPGPEDLYDIINERYEKGSILLTSNRAPAEWPDLFNDPLLASAGLDRLLDRAEVLIIRGDSYRAQNRARIEQEISPPNA